MRSLRGRDGGTRVRFRIRRKSRCPVRRAARPSAASPAERACPSPRSRVSEWTKHGCIVGDRQTLPCHGMQAPRASSLTCPFERGSGAAAGTGQTPACSAHRDSLVVQGHQCSRSSNSDSLNCENARGALYAQPMRSATLVVGRASSVRLPASDIARATRARRVHCAVCRLGRCASTEPPRPRLAVCRSGRLPTRRGVGC